MPAQARRGAAMPTGEAARARRFPDHDERAFVEVESHHGCSLRWPRRRALTAIKEEPAARCQHVVAVQSAKPMLPLAQFKRLDVRPLLVRGEEPLPTIRAKVNALKREQGLIVIAPFLPSPLI